MCPSLSQLLGREASRVGHGDRLGHEDNQRPRGRNHLSGALRGQSSAGHVEQGRQGEGVRCDDLGRADGVRDGSTAELRGVVADSRPFGGGGRRRGA